MAFCSAALIHCRHYGTGIRLRSLEEHDGWVSRDTAQRFAEYTDTVFRALGDVVPAWMTVNEPKTVVQAGDLYGGHAPGYHNPHKAYAALHHLLLAHGLAVQAFRASAAQGQIGIVYVDFPTQRRTPKRSALWYRDVIRQHGLGDLPDC